jgi:hypothetical protein
MQVEPGTANTAAWTVLGQFHQDDNPNTPSASPPFAINLIGEKMAVSIGYNSPTGAIVSKTIFTDANDIQRGHYYAMDIQVTFAPNGNGHLVVTRDGIKIVDYTGPLGYTTQASVYWKEGIYRAASSDTMAADYSNLSVTTSASVSPNGAATGPVSYNQYDGSGKVVATVTTYPDGSTSTSSFDGSGNLTKTVNVKADGSSDISDYGITGQSYTSDHVVFNATGQITSITRYHADGTRDSSRALNADGSTTYNVYDATGHLTKTAILHTDGSTDGYDYAITGQTYTSDHYVVNAAGKYVAVTRYHSDGTLDSSQTLNNDGSTTYTKYDATGHLTQTMLVKADGSKDIHDYGIKGQTYTSDHIVINATGTSNTITRYHADGTLDSAQALNADGSSTYSKYDSTGHLIQTTNLYTDGSKDGWDYGISGQTYSSDHYVVNSKGTMTSLTRYHSDGTLDYSQMLGSDGSTTYNRYDSTSRLMQTSITHSDGSRDLYDFNITGKTYISDHLVYDKTGAITQMTQMHTDGSKDVYDYGIIGQSYVRDHLFYDASGNALQTTRYHADGTLQFNRIVASDGTTTTALYDSTGKQTETLVIQPNLTQTVTAYAAGLTMTSGTGNDTFTSFQNDTFVFHANSGNDIINKFHAGDLATHDFIQIDKSLVADFAHLSMNQKGADVVIAIDAHDSITLKNTSLSALTSHDFLFA